MADTITANENGMETRTVCDGRSLHVSVSGISAAGNNATGDNTAGNNAAEKPGSRVDRIGTRREVRAVRTQFQTREENGEAPHISGYFAVFDGVYEIGPGMTESVDRDAFRNTLGGDIRALTNHDTTLVLGRTKNHTLTLSVDEHGLFGDIQINPNDVDAMNLYERVRRGDVDQCSFGFDIISEETELRDDGSVHWTIKEVELFEVSCCTFPAYKDTNISAREAQKDEAERRKADAEREERARTIDAWKADALNRIRLAT